MSRRWVLFLLSIVLIAATVCIYAPVRDADFVSFDDFEYVRENSRVASGLSLDNARWAFTRYHAANWHPLTWLSYMADVEVFGLNPAGFHIVSLALHVANVVLLFLLLASVTGDVVPSFAVAALFALHPANVESVAWISQRKTTLSTFFLLLTLWSYCRYAVRPTPTWYVASLLFFAASLMSKQQYVLLGFALLGFDYWPLRRAVFRPSPGSSPSVRGLLRAAGKLFPEKIPFLLLAVLAGCATLVAQQSAIQSLERLPWDVRLANVALAYVRYLATFFWPEKLAVFYPMHAEALTPARVAAAVAALAVLTVAAFLAGRQWRYWLSGWVWYVLMLVPVVGVIQVGGQSMADRYAYVPFWGIAMPVAWSLSDISRAIGRRALVPLAAAFAAALVGIGVLAFRRAEAFKDTISLATEAVANTDANWMAHRALGSEYNRLGNFPKAIEHTRKVVEYAEDNPIAWTEYACVLQNSSNSQPAEDALQRAIQIDPDYAVAFSQLSLIFALRGEFDRALEYAATAATKLASPSGVRHSSDHVRIYRNWGSVLFQLHRFAEAADKYDIALSRERNSLFVLREAAEIDLRLDRLDSAARRLETAIAQDSADARAFFLLGEVYARQGRDSESKKWFEESARRSPADQPRWRAEMLVQKGDAARARGDMKTAIQCYRNALEEQADNYSLNNNLAWILAANPDPALRDPKTAVALANRACKLARRRDHSTLGTLAAAYAADAQFTNAVTTAQEALQLAQLAGDAIAASDLQSQLRSYEQGRPFADPSLAGNASTMNMNP